MDNKYKVAFTNYVNRVGGGGGVLKIFTLLYNFYTEQ